jgi:hypothetical protein
MVDTIQLHSHSFIPDISYQITLMLISLSFLQRGTEVQCNLVADNRNDIESLYVLSDCQVPYKNLYYYYSNWRTPTMLYIV